MNSSAPNLLPPSVVQRLQAERARIEKGAFSSALGVGEMLLARQSGYRVLGQVMGASVYQFGGQRQFANWRDFNWRDADAPAWRFELSAYSDAVRGAFEVALQRLCAEATGLRADGVIGVRVQLKKPQQLQGDQIECAIVGTAVMRPDSRGKARETGAPFTSNLSGAETWMLERVGYAPCALVFECCALLQALSGETRAFIMSLHSPGEANYEFREYTDAIYSARETVMQRLKTGAHSAGASGILNVQIELEEHLEVDPKLPGVNSDTPHQIFALIAQGTAVKPLGAPQINRVTSVTPLT